MTIANGEGNGEISNRLLLALPAASLRRLEPQLEPVELVQGTSLYRVGAPVKRLYFIDRGFVSIVKTMRDGRTVEVGNGGNGDAIGIFSVHGVGNAAWDSVVQVPGSGWRLDTDALRAETDGSTAVRRLVERYTYQLLGDMAQTAACHRLHGLRERFCRWLLSAQDNARSDTLPLTHETLALMLGVQRSGVSIVASEFQKQGVLRNHRGRIEIRERGALVKGACECYESHHRALTQLYSSTRGEGDRGNSGSSD